MNKIELSLNYAEILQRIEADMTKYKPLQWAKSLGIGINVVSNYHGKSAKRNPSLEYVIAVAKFTGKPIEWYLYGTSQEEKTQPPTEKSESAGIELSEQFIEVHKKVEDILVSGTNYADVLQQNIEVFHKAVANQEEADKDLVGLKKNLRKEIKEELKKELRNETAKLIKNQIDEHQKKFSHMGFPLRTGTGREDGTEN